MISETLWAVCADLHLRCEIPMIFLTFPLKLPSNWALSLLRVAVSVGLRCAIHRVVFSRLATTNDGVWEEAGRSPEGRVPPPTTHPLQWAAFPSVRGEILRSAFLGTL